MSPVNDNDPEFFAEDDLARLTYVGCAILVGCAATLFWKAVFG